MQVSQWDFFVASSLPTVLVWIPMLKWQLTFSCKFRLRRSYLFSNFEANCLPNGWQHGTAEAAAVKQLCTVPTSQVAQCYRMHLPMQETWVWALGREDPLEKEMATHSSIVAWKTPWTEEQSVVSQSWTRLSDWIRMYSSHGVQF